MDKKQSLTIGLELIWWVITALVVWAVLHPIHKAMQVWPFEGWNIAFVIILITFARYLFLMKHTLLARQQEIKVVLFLCMFPLTFVLMNQVNTFMVYIEENTWDTLTGHLPVADKKAIESYIWNEMLFFGVGAAISTPAFAVRLLISVWRTRNRGTA